MVVRKTASGKGTGWSLGRMNFQLWSPALVLKSSIPHYRPRQLWVLRTSVQNRHIHLPMSGHLVSSAFLRLETLAAVLSKSSKSSSWPIVSKTAKTTLTQKSGKLKLIRNATFIEHLKAHFQAVTIERF